MPIIGTGSEVEIAVEAQQLLANQGVQARVVSMPCWRLFEEMPQAIKMKYYPHPLPPASPSKRQPPWARNAILAGKGQQLALTALVWCLFVAYKTIYRKLGLKQWRLRQ